jgi:Flp pilus assembly protein TadD
MRKLWIVLAVVAVAAGTVAVALWHGNHEWTTDSPKALAEFQAGLNASMKYYRNDARLHFAKAVELDPSFLVAKAFLLDYLDRKRDEKGFTSLLAELKAADLSAVTPRERFLVERDVALADGEHDRARQLTEAFVTAYPEDPYGLFARGNDAVAAQDLEAAQRVFSRLIDIAPNSVMAYNHLGYIAMAEGKFSQAEKMFFKYRYIAPDQANPHDSLGELYMLLGRYDEAEQEFEAAIQAKLDFYDSYLNLARLAWLRGDDQKLQEALFRAKESGSVPPSMLAEFQCSLHGWQAAAAGRWPEVASLVEGACREGMIPYGLKMRALYFTGRPGAAAKVAAELQAHAEESVGRKNRGVLAILAHLDGVAAAAQGDANQAVKAFRDADGLYTYYTFNQGLMKLFNLASEARALALMGAKSESAAVQDQIRAVNPHILDVLGDAPALPTTTP